MTKTEPLSLLGDDRALSKAITDEGNTIFATIDQSAAAKTAACLCPNHAHHLRKPQGRNALDGRLSARRRRASMKAARVGRDGNVSVAYVTMSEIAARYGVAGMDERIAANGSSGRRA